MNQVSDAGLSRRWPVLAGLGVSIAVVVYLLAVRTADGQALENAALRGADQASDRDTAQASANLDRITVYSLAVAVLLIALVAVLRRRIDLLLAGVGVIVAGQVVVQTLKRYVLPRPELVETTGYFTQNSLPSGYTTIAMTVLFVTVLVVPYRWRGLALLVVVSWAVSVGQYTLTAKWHRLSDTLAAEAISLTLACLASWWLVRRGAVRRVTGRARVIPVLVTVLLSASALLGLAIGVVLWAVPLRAEGVRGATHDDEWNIYLGATSFASAGSILAALAFLAAWHRLDTSRPTARTEARTDVLSLQSRQR
ncbi:phosphatase PAP2 family protein [Nocardia sp. NBC_01327]|uniref:phosphatase PAP2 family protein n=1 Tax=Nocardia sp. NBC_01327 TaxID=2903593 RepID=UPI002E12C3BA|nr:phosphatase PAP2 family protein [Nocardia sp. NBC_01327]